MEIKPFVLSSNYLNSKKETMEQINWDRLNFRLCSINQRYIGSQVSFYTVIN